MDQKHSPDNAAHLYFRDLLHSTLDRLKMAATVEETTVKDLVSR